MHAYIGRQRRGRQRDIPIFPIDIWGVYDRTVNRLPLTNNHIEAWHKRFNLTSGMMSHPNIWKFLNALKNEESRIRVDIHHHHHHHNHRRKHMQTAQQGYIILFRTTK